MTLFQLIMSSTVAPKALYMSRGIIKNSDLSFFPSIVKEKKFNDTVKGLTERQIIPPKIIYSEKDLFRPGTKSKMPNTKSKHNR